MDTRSTGFLVIAIGIGIVIIGLLVLSGALSWFGRLPGDIRIERGNSYIYIPITTMILISVGLTLLLYLVRRLF